MSDYNKSSSTIAAIATGQAAGGIGVVRISGPDAIEIASRVFKCRSGEELSDLAGYRARYGRMVAAKNRGDSAVGWEDDGVALVFRSPHSYTGEDVVELSCHGGLYAVRTLLRACIEAGAQPAGRGEFTKRAFLNGKLSLTQAEAVMAVISAEGQQADRAAKAALGGKLSDRIADVTKKLTALCANIEVWCDFPDDDFPEVTDEDILAILENQINELDNLIEQSEAGILLRDGIDTVLAGRPNVGKSTLMNLIAGREKSIVTDVPGTTRDIIEERVSIDGVILRIADTAGLRETDNKVEAIGVERTRARMDSAALILAVFDGGEELTGDDRDLIELIKMRPCVAIINKSDQPQLIDDGYIRERAAHMVSVSAADGRGMDELTAAIMNVTRLSGLDPSAGLLINERQMDCARQARRLAAEAIDAAKDGVTLDAVGVLIGDAVRALLELSGEGAEQHVVDEIFSRFCVGK